MAAAPQQHPRSNGLRSSSAVSESSAASTPSSSPSAAALPSDEALEVLLSPDGYYAYLGVPKPDPSTSMPPRYAAANDAGNGKGGDDGIDLDLVKKNYRRLSLRHHPDRKTGDPETFRVLHRAKVVLSSPKLRREYDLVGLDLEDDVDDHDHRGDDGAGSGGAGDGEENDDDDVHANSSKEGSKSSTDTVMSHLASVTLAAVLQMVVRTGLMGMVAVVITRYTILVSGICLEV